MAERAFGLSRLTKRETEVFWQLVEGRRNLDIARALGLSIRTVETHRFNVRKKLGIDAIADAVRLLYPRTLPPTGE